MNNKVEYVLDIVATISILIKFEMDQDVLATQTKLIAFLSEVGFKSMSGQELTVMNFRTTVERLRPHEKRYVVNEFKMMFENPKIAQLLGKP